MNAFQSNAFQHTGFQAIPQDAFQRNAFQATGFQTTAVPAVTASSGRGYKNTYSARKFYALREQIEREREELALALVAIEQKKAGQQREAKERADAPPAPYVAPQIDVGELVREVAEAVRMATNLRHMENELIAAEILEAELQDEDDLIVALAA